MRRHCDGKDPNLVMEIFPQTGEKIVDSRDPRAKHTVDKPCDCGRVFDDVYYSTIYPHRAI